MKRKYAIAGALTGLIAVSALLWSMRQPDARPIDTVDAADDVHLTAGRLHIIARRSEGARLFDVVAFDRGSGPATTQIIMSATAYPEVRAAKTRWVFQDAIIHSYNPNGSQKSEARLKQLWFVVH